MGGMICESKRKPKQRIERGMFRQQREVELLYKVYHQEEEECMISAETFLLINCWRKDIHLPDECFSKLLKGSFLGHNTIEMKVWVVPIPPSLFLQAMSI